MSKPDYILLAEQAGQLVYTDDVLDDDVDSPTYDKFVRTFQSAKAVDDE